MCVCELFNALCLSVLFSYEPDLHYDGVDGNDGDTVTRQKVVENLLCGCAFGVPKWYTRFRDWIRLSRRWQEA